MRILIVDDKASFRDLLSQFLGRDYTVVTKNNGLDAFTWLQKGNIPDLIISDIEMPKMDGFEFISKVKQSGFYSNVPLLVLSCRDSSSDRIACLKAGADDYLSKPFNPEELLIRIEKAFKKQRL